VGERDGAGLGVGDGSGVELAGGGIRTRAARIPAATAAALPIPMINNCSLESSGRCCSRTRGSSHSEIIDSSS
jgi:hypothetical protein